MHDSVFAGRSEAGAVTETVLDFMQRRGAVAAAGDTGGFPFAQQGYATPYFVAVSGEVAGHHSGEVVEEGRDVLLPGSRSCHCAAGGSSSKYSVMCLSRFPQLHVTISVTAPERKRTCSTG